MATFTPDLTVISIDDDRNGGSVARPDGFIFRVDLDLCGDGEPNCTCAEFQQDGDCEHLDLFWGEVGWAQAWDNPVDEADAFGARWQ